MQAGDCLHSRSKTAESLAIVAKLATAARRTTPRWWTPLVSIMAIAMVTLPLRSADSQSTDPALQLGKRLFLEKRFTNPASNVPGNCYSCHRPRWAPEGRRAYCDTERYSLVPTHFGSSTKSTTLRNVPTLLDIAGWPRFNHDGRYLTLEDTIQAELTSRHLGWEASDRETALDEIYWVLLNDAGVDQNTDATYLEQFQRAYNIDLQSLTRDAAVGWVVKCLTQYVAHLRSSRNSPFDAFLRANLLPESPNSEQSAAMYADSLLVSTRELERRGTLQLPEKFGWTEYEGFRVFMRTAGESSVGNCVLCHVPPLFADGGFHNTGIAQAEYDAIHGRGAFAKLRIPEISQVSRPLGLFEPKVVNGQQVQADLGFWNFAEAPSTNALAAFKTPTLRNLKDSDPYMHNGAYRSVQDAVAQKVDACEAMQAGRLRAPDAGLANMHIGPGDIGPLVAFLAALNDAPDDRALPQ